MQGASRGLADHVRKATTSLGGLQGVLGRLALAETGRRMVNVAASFQQVQLRLKLLSQEYGENAKAQQLAAKAAKTFGLSQTEALSGITDIYARLRPIGVELKDIESTFIGFNTAAKMSGVSAAQASGAFLQLAQALGSGRLQGDEFRSIAEQLPKLNQVIAKEMGVPIGQLKKLASEGKVTAEVVIKALKRIEKEGAGAIAGLMEKDPTQKFKDFQNAVEKLSIAVGGKLLPAVLPLVKGLTALVNAVGALPEPVIATAAAVIAIGAAAGPVAAVLAKMGAALKVVATFVALAGLKFLGFKAVVLAFLALPVVAGLVAVGGAIGLIVKQLNKGNEATKKFNKEIKEGTKPLEDAEWRLRELNAEIKKLTIQQKNLDMSARGAGARSNWITQQIEKIKEMKKELKTVMADAAFDEKWKTYEIEGVGVFERLSGVMIRETDKMIAKSKELEESMKRKKKLADDLKKKWKDIGQTVKSDVTDSIKGAIQGSQTLGEAMGNVLRRIADQALEVAINMALWGSVGAGGSRGLLGGFFTGIFGEANGGPVSGGSSYVVGERGPEIFTPHSSGKITPNHAIGGGGTEINVAVDASGSSVEGKQAEGQMLGEAIGVAIQRELIKQRLPGGLLY